MEDTIAILRGLKERYEVFHGVKITDSALIAAATLSDRYITDRFLPDKAIDLVDEACAMIRTEIDSMPQEMDEISRKIMQQEIEEAALANEGGRLVPPEQLADVQERTCRAARQVRRHEGHSGRRKRAPSVRCRSCARRSSRPTPRSNRRSGNTT